MLRFLPDPSVLQVLPDPLHAKISTWSICPSSAPWSIACYDISLIHLSFQCSFIHHFLPDASTLQLIPDPLLASIHRSSITITCILCIHILKLINTLDHAAPAPVAHAYLLLPDLSLEQLNLEIIFIRLTGMVVLVQVAVVFFYTTIIFMKKAVWFLLFNMYILYYHTLLHRFHRKARCLLSNWRIQLEYLYHQWL